VEDVPCWAVSVDAFKADFAEELLANNGFMSAASPDLLVPGPLSPRTVGFLRVVIIVWLVSVGLLVIGVVLDILGVVDLGRLVSG
jgi:hypothetical protein